MLNIVIPMAGRGSRFVKAGYTVPKLLIDVFGEPMISLVTKNISNYLEMDFILREFKELVVAERSGGKRNYAFCK